MAKYLASMLCVLMGTAVSVAGEVRVNTDFEGGSARVESIDQATRTVRFMPGGDPQRGWPCWWFLRVEGLTKGEQFTLDLAGSDRFARNNGKDSGKPLAASWSTPTRAAISTDGKTWQHSPAGKRTGDRIQYKIVAEGDSVYVAWGPPFTLQTAREVIAAAEKATPAAKSFELCRTREGRPVPALRVSEATGAKPFGLWVGARQHAWESGGSWVGRGFTEWLVSDDAEAAWLRKHAEVFIVPIMDVDNVATGNGGKEADPHDHNRDWTDKPVYPEVAAVQERLRQLAKEDRLDLFVDLHNPALNDLRPFFFCGPPELLSQTSRANRETFLKLAREHINGPLVLEDKPRITGPSYHPLWRQISGQWVTDHGNTHTIAVCLETSWNTPHSTTTGYHTVGRQLGLAIAAYLRTNPRDAAPLPEKSKENTRSEIDPTVKSQLAIISQVGLQAAGSTAARAARNGLAKRGLEILPPLLAAMDTSNNVAANWYRTVFEEIVARHQSTPAADWPLTFLKEYVSDANRSGRPRRLVLAQLDRLEPGFQSQWLPSRLSDAEFRYDAVAAALVTGEAALKKQNREEATVAFRSAFENGRDATQVAQSAAKLRSLGESADPIVHLGLVIDWWLVGPFDAPGKTGYTRSFEPESKADVRAKYFGQSGNEIGWIKHRATDTLGLVNFNEALGATREAVGYAFAEVDVSAERAAQIRCGADDNCTVWLNGTKVFSREQWLNGTRFDRFITPVTLRAGRNALLVKVCQGPQHRDPEVPNNWSLQLRLSDDDGRGIPFQVVSPN